MCKTSEFRKQEPLVAELAFFPSAFWDVSIPQAGSGQSPLSESSVWEGQSRAPAISLCITLYSHEEEIQVPSEEVLEERGVGQVYSKFCAVGGTILQIW